MDWRQLDWRLLTAIVCAFGFFKDLRPSEAYLTKYLTGPWKNLTIEEVDNEVYPWWTYSYLLWLLPVFLLTDFFRYKPVLVLDGVAYISTWGLLLWAQGVPLMKLMQVVYGLATAAEIGYYSYLFAKVSTDRYKQIASFLRAASLGGKFAAYLAGQLLVSFSLLDFFQLNIFSFVSVCIAFIIAVILPKAEHSEIFHRRRDDENITESADGNMGSKIKSGFIFLFNELKVIYSVKQTVTWSVWWALASCGNFQVGNYIQNLWSILTPYQKNSKIYNGAVEAAAGLLGMVSVLVVGFIPINWSEKGRAEILITLACGINSAVLIFMANTKEIWVAYILYVIFRALFQTVITIATAQIAQSLLRQRYGFVFGCNTFFALLIETILTAVVVDKAGLNVDIVTQFDVYGGYFAVMTAFFAIFTIYNCYKGNYTSPTQMESSQTGAITDPMSSVNDIHLENLKG